MKPYKIFIEMKKLPKGYIIDNPYGLVEADFTISKNVLHILQADSNLVFFTRLSIKHLAEKEIDGDHIFGIIRLILNDPEKIYMGNYSNRFLISKDVLFQTGPKPHVIVVEINKKTNNIIVTGFIANQNYFKNLKLLWGTAFSPSQQSPKG